MPSHTKVSLCGAFDSSPPSDATTMAEVRAEESEMAKELRELKKLRDDGVIDESLFRRSRARS